MHRAVLVMIAGLLCLLVACGGSGEAGQASRTPALIVGGPPSASAAPSPSPPAPSPTRAPGVISLDWLASDVTLPDLPPFAGSLPDAGLQAAVEAALEGREGSYSVVVHNLADGRSAVVDGDRVYYAASLFKAALLLEAYRQRDAGQQDFGREVTLTEEDAANDLGTLELLGIQAADTLTMADAIKAMIVVSDTPTASLVEREVGGSAPVDATLRAAGIGTMSVSRGLPTTASDMALLLETIAGRADVSAQSRHEMLSLLAQEDFTGGVIASLPPDTPVVHKTGSFDSATHDVAIVWGPAGPYTIAILSDHSFDWDPLREISAAVYDYFSANP